MSSLDANVRPAKTKGVSISPAILSWASATAATHEFHDFHLIALFQNAIGALVARNNVQIHFHGHGFALDLQFLKQGRQAEAVLHGLVLAVELDRSHKP